MAVSVLYFLFLCLLSLASGEKYYGREAYKKDKGNFFHQAAGGVYNLDKKLIGVIVKTQNENSSTLPQYLQSQTKLDLDDLQDKFIDPITSADTKSAEFWLVVALGFPIVLMIILWLFHLIWWIFWCCAQCCMCCCCKDRKPCCCCCCCWSDTHGPKICWKVYTKVSFILIALVIFFACLMAAVSTFTIPAVLDSFDDALANGYNVSYQISTVGPLVGSGISTGKALINNIINLIESYVSISDLEVDVNAIKKEVEGFSDSLKQFRVSANTLYQALDSGIKDKVNDLKEAFYLANSPHLEFEGSVSTPSCADDGPCEIVGSITKCTATDVGNNPSLMKIIDDYYTRAKYQNEHQFCHGICDLKSVINGLRKDISDLKLDAGDMVDKWKSRMNKLYDDVVNITSLKLDKTFDKVHESIEQIDDTMTKTFDDALSAHRARIGDLQWVYRFVELANLKLHCCGLGEASPAADSEELQCPSSGYSASAHHSSNNVPTTAPSSSDGSSSDETCDPECDDPTELNVGTECTTDPKSSKCSCSKIVNYINKYFCGTNAPSPSSASGIEVHIGPICQTFRDRLSSKGVPFEGFPEASPTLVPLIKAFETAEDSVNDIKDNLCTASNKVSGSFGEISNQMDVLNVTDIKGKYDDAMKNLDDVIDKLDDLPISSSNFTEISSRINATLDQISTLFELNVDSQSVPTARSNAESYLPDIELPFDVRQYLKLGTFSLAGIFIITAIFVVLQFICGVVCDKTGCFGCCSCYDFFFIIFFGFIFLFLAIVGMFFFEFSELYYSDEFNTMITASETDSGDDGVIVKMLVDNIGSIDTDSLKVDLTDTITLDFSDTVKLNATIYSQLLNLFLDYSDANAKNEATNPILRIVSRLYKKAKEELHEKLDDGWREVLEENVGSIELKPMAEMFVKYGLDQTNETFTFDTAQFEKCKKESSANDDSEGIPIAECLPKLVPPIKDNYRPTIIPEDETVMSLLDDVMANLTHIADSKLVPSLLSLLDPLTLKLPHTIIYWFSAPYLFFLFIPWFICCSGCARTFWPPFEDEDDDEEEEEDEDDDEEEGEERDDQYSIEKEEDDEPKRKHHHKHHHHKDKHRKHKHNDSRSIEMQDMEEGRNRGSSRRTARNDLDDPDMDDDKF